jgi:tetraacyldisaccharide 4'-kinase
LLDRLYGAAARWRRHSVERRPERRRRLARTVVSVGNLSMGGTGKTPVVAALAERLVDMGERPAILSRGYRRADEVPGVVVVSEGRGPIAPLARSGDEPWMLSRAVPGAIVCVSPDRYLSGTLAERVLGATIHILDDGFQHVTLGRDLDVLVTSPGEIQNGRVLPVGRLREPLGAAARAHILVVMGAGAEEAAAEAWTLGVSLSCGASRHLQSPAPVGRSVSSASSVSPETNGVRDFSPADTSPVVVACGIANPDRFVKDLETKGWQVARVEAFSDHHQYRARDLARIAAACAESGAGAVLTTDKDAVRFEACGELPFALYRVPMTVTFEPASTLFDSVVAVLNRDRATPTDRGDASERRAGSGHDRSDRGPA